MEHYWSIDNVLQALEQYKLHPELWDPQHPDYRNRLKKLEAWTRMADDMGVDRDKLEKRMKNCVFQYRREKKKLDSLKEAGNVAIRSGWFAYDAMEFLENVGPCKKQVEQPSMPNLETERPEPTPEWEFTGGPPIPLAACKTEPVTEEPKMQIKVELMAPTPKLTPMLKLTTTKPISILTPKLTPAPTPTTSTGKRKRGLDVAEDPLDIQSDAAQSLDECTVFGELVAHKLRDIKDTRRRLLVQHKINTLLLHEQLNQTPDVTPCPILFEPTRF